jgi:hypothetical protein
MADLDNTSDDGALTVASGIIPATVVAWTSSTTVNSTAVVVTLGFGSVLVTYNPVGTITGGALVFEASDDSGVTWYSIQAVDISNNNITGAGNPFTLSGQIANVFQLQIAGFTNVRVRLSTVISGTGTSNIRIQAFAFTTTPTTIITSNNANAARIQLSDGTNNSVLTATGALTVSLPDSTLVVSTTAATGVAVTATLPAVAGQFHHITSLHITKYFTAANAASATPLLVTTTNLPGSLTFTFGQPLGVIGTTDVRMDDFSFPLRSSVVNTNTTIVCPATTGIIWRINCIYYAAA